MKITPSLKSLIQSALKEDRIEQDVTTLGLDIKNLKIRACICSRQEGILAGLKLCRAVFSSLGRVKWESKFYDGQSFKNGDEIANLEGKADMILGAERVALNFLSHLSGIATFTEKFVKIVAHNKVRIYDTRKTIPLLRKLEKYAVKLGGGYNHRLDLSEAVMIKDNHSAIFRKKYFKEDYIVKMVKLLRKKYPKKELILEVHNLEEWLQAIEAKPDVVMFDNWESEDIEKALKMLSKKEFEIEISGQVNLNQLEKILKLGIDRISLGCITHSAPAIDFSLDVVI